MTKRLCAAVLLATVMAPAGAAEIVVLESSSPRYVAGRTIDAAQPLKLTAGETLTIATEDGRLVRIVGPHDGPATGPAPDDNAARRALALLVASDRPEVGGIGGVRGDSASSSLTDTRPGTWFVHTELGGEQCVLREQAVRLWRETAVSAGAMEVRVSMSDVAALARWDAGAQQTAWPPSIDPIDGTIYLLRAEGAVRSVPVRLHVLPATLAAPGVAAAAWLAARGCTAQARLALR